MAVISNYTTLIQAIKDVVEDDGSELSSYIPTAIALAEERLMQELDFPELEDSKTGTLTANNKLVSKPATNDAGVSAFFYTNALGNKVLLRKRTIDFIYDYWPKDTNTGEPKYYSNYNLTQLVVAPTPNSTYAYEIRYYTIPTRLSTTNLNNYFTDKECKQALFAASMVHVSIFMKSPADKDIWEAQYQQAASDWNYLAQRQRRDSSDVPNNPQGGPNTIKHTVGTGSSA